MTRNRIILLLMVIAVLFVTRGGEFVCSHELISPGQVTRASVLVGSTETPLYPEEMGKFLSLYNLGEDPLRDGGYPRGSQVILDLEGNTMVRVWAQPSGDRAFVETVSFNQVKRYTVHAPELVRYIRHLSVEGQTPK